MQASKIAHREVTVSVLITPPPLFRGESKIVTVSLYRHGNISLESDRSNGQKVRLILPPDQTSCLVTLAGPIHHHLYAHASVLIEKADHPELNYGFKSVPYLGYRIEEIWPGEKPVALDLGIRHFEPYNIFSNSRPGV